MTLRRTVSNALTTLVIAIASVVASAPAASAGDAAAPEARSGPVRLMVMGDSLADEAMDYLRTLVADRGQMTIDDRLVYGGSAICDWVPEKLDKVLQTFQPEIAVAEFVGNNKSVCMRDALTGLPLEGKKLRDKYFHDANEAMRMFTRHGVTVYWVNTPPSCPDQVMPVASVWRRVVRTWDNARLIDAARVATDDGQCAEFLPCLEDEPCTAVDPATGQPAAVVRAPDGTHFCPSGAPAVGGVTQACPVWASGAWRFARAIAEPIVGDVLGGGGSPPPTLPGPADLIP